MKILLLTDRMEAGGAETHVFQLACDLKNEGHEVLLWSSGGALASQLAQNGICCIKVSAPSRNPITLLKKRLHLWRLVKKERIQVLHAHTRLTAQLIRGFHRHGCAEVVTAHARFKSNFFLSRVCHWGQITVAVGEDLRAYLTKTYRRPVEATRVIPNGVDLCRFFPKAQSAQEPSVLFASRLDGDCALGAELLCKIATDLCSRFPNLKITIAGGGSEHVRISRMAEDANRKIGRNAIHLLGWTEDMVPVFREHSVFVGVSRAAIEAAACGCAVILCGNEGYLGIWDKRLSEHASLSNFCARGEAKATKARLAADLCVLLSDHEYRRHVALDACAFVRSRLDSKRIAQQTLDVYLEALPKKPSCRVAIGGYFGCGNLGDDAILQGILHELKRTHPHVGVTVLSGSPQKERQGLRVKSVPRKNPIALSAAMLRSDLFLLGGGSLLQNRTGNLSLFYYLGLLQLSHLLGRPSALYACGIGPLLGDRAKHRVTKTLFTTRNVNLRDEESWRLLREMQLSKTLLTVGADAALLLPPPEPFRTLFLKHAFSLPSGKPILGIILRAPNKALQPKFGILLAALQAFCRKHQARPLFLVFDRKRDYAVVQKILSANPDLQAKCAIPQSPSDALSLLSLCRVTLSMRLHGAILSAHVGTPCVAVSADECDTKIPAFASLVKQPLLSLNTLDASAVEASLASAMATHKKDLQARICHLRKKAQKDLANALRIVYNNR